MSKQNLKNPSQELKQRHLNREDDNTEGICRLGPTLVAGTDDPYVKNKSENF